MLAFSHGYSALWIYFLLFPLLFLCGVGFPMAEELVLLGGGAMVASGVLDPVLMLVVTFSVSSSAISYCMASGEVSRRV